MTKIHSQDAMPKTAANKKIRNKITEREMEMLVEYLLTKFGQKDWEGVLNVVKDLRKINAIKLFRVSMCQCGWLYKIAEKCKNPIHIIKQSCDMRRINANKKLRHKEPAP